jgi:hypothetical protein
MRREKRREENAKRFFVQQDRLREKRKNSDPSSVTTAQNYSASGQVTANGDGHSGGRSFAKSKSAAAGFFAASEK